MMIEGASFVEHKPFAALCDLFKRFFYNIVEPFSQEFCSIVSLGVSTCHARSAANVPHAQPVTQFTCSLPHLRPA